MAAFAELPPTPLSTAAAPPTSHRRCAQDAAGRQKEQDKGGRAALALGVTLRVEQTAFAGTPICFLYCREQHIYAV